MNNKIREWKQQLMAELNSSRERNDRKGNIR